MVEVGALRELCAAADGELAEGETISSCVVEFRVPVLVSAQRDAAADTCSIYLREFGTFEFEGCRGLFVESPSDGDFYGNLGTFRYYRARKCYFLLNTRNDSVVVFCIQEK